MSKNASSEKKSSSPAGTKKQNVIIFKPDEIAKFGLFGDNLVAGNTKTTNPGRSSTPEESEPSTSRHNASISPKMKRGKSTRESIKALSVSGDTSVSTDTQSGIDVKRKIGDILKKTFQEMKKFEPDKFQPKNTSSVSGTKVSLDCDKKSEIVSLLKHAKNKKEAGIETESIEAGVSDSSKKVKVIGITSVKYSDEEIQSILKGSGNSNPKSNTVVQSDDSTASKLTNKVVASELPTQKTSPTKSSQFDSKGNTVGSKYKHGHVDEIIDLEEKIIPAKKAPREHVDAKALVANKDLDRINIDKNASIADTSELLDSEGSTAKLESITSTTIEKKVSETQSVVDFNNPADFDYYIIQFPPSDDTKSTCDKDKTCNTEVKAVEQESVAETTEEIQKELIDDETKPAKKLEEIDIEDELSYSVLTMEKSEDPNEPEDEVPKTKKLAGQELTDPDVTSEKVVKVINVEKHPEPVGDESIFKVNVVLEVPKPEVVDTVQFCPRKRKQQIDCKVDEEEPFEKTNKHRTKKNRIEDDECMVDSSKFKCIKQYGVKPHLTNQNPIADMAGETDLLELNDLASVVRIENDESLEEAAEEVQPMDSQQVTTDEVKPAPKKRGRPRRKQLYMDEDVPATVFCPIESSKSGRKRRKINYFNLENSLYGEMEENSSGIGKKKGRPRKVKTEDELTVLQSATDESFGESSADVSLAEIVESKTSVKQNPEEPTGEDTSEPVANKEEFLSLDKVRKYRRTGKTVEMVNSIFTAAMNTLNETQNLDTSVDGQKEQASVNMVKRIKLKGKRDGRCKREETFELNEKNEITCVVCQENVFYDKWEEHNSEVHYDLSWRAGENILLDIDLDAFVKKKVEPFLRKLKQLICDKCQTPFTASSAFIKHREECYGILVNNMVICALCKEEMTRDKFYAHRQKKHNSLAWRVGDVPLDLNNQYFVMSVLNARYKAKKPLFCYKCNTAKKSVIGYLSHQSQCGVNENDAKISCPECGRKVLPVSMPVHIKMVHETPKMNKVTISEDGPVLDYKRRAAKNAMSMITMFSKGNMIEDASKYYVENPEFTESFVKYCLQKEANTNTAIKCKFKDCKFTTLSVDHMVSHLKSCDLKPPKHFTCRKCLATYTTLDALSVHVKDVHNKSVDDETVQFSDETSDDDMDNADMIRDARVVQKTKKAEAQSVCKVKPLCIAKLQRPGKSMLFSCAFEYNLEFCNNCFSQSELFNQWHCTKENWKLIDENLIHTYLPQSEISCEVGIKQVRGFGEMNQCFFNRFELFEAKIQENHVTMYCGGPINALCWLPTPYLRLDCRQVLAVAVTNDFDSRYHMKTNYAEPTAVQLWDFGNLKNKHSITMPRLMYCIALNIGPVWHMEWCPSGCFDESSSTNGKTFNRLGLLAVAGSVPGVHVYAVPKLSEEDWGLVYTTKPVLKLQLSNTQDCGNGNYYPTKIAWCKASRHSILAVGYTNGMVAMFNLNCNSSLLKIKDEDEVEVLLPYKSIQAHKFAISMLQVLHHADGDRWLLTGGADKSYVWDLKNDTFVNISPKKHILDGIWLTHWLSTVTAHDDINVPKAGAGAGQLNCIRKFLSDTGSLVTSQTSVNTISCSDWLNSIISGNQLGEILAYFPQQMLFNAQDDKWRSKYKKALGYTKLIKKGNQEKKADNEIETADMLEYKKAVTKYGVVFCDLKMDKSEDLPSDAQRLNNKHQEISKPNVYPLQTINKISFNPNCQASLYYATGYQIGFVRASYLKFLDSDKQVV